jgi:hypothetical protein
MANHLRPCLVLLASIVSCLAGGAAAQEFSEQASGEAQSSPTRDPWLDETVSTASYPTLAQAGPPPTDYYQQGAPQQPDVFAPLPWGPWREFKARGTWLGGSDLDFVELETWSIFALPTFSLETPIVFTPFYGLHLADGPKLPDLPAELHDIYLDVNWIFNVKPDPGEWSAHLAVRPGLFSDFQQDHDGAFRLQARGLVIYRYSETLTFVAGGQWLDREDVPFLPLGGIIYTPDENTSIELLSPRSKLAKRVAWCGGCSTWAYLAAEFGGESWAIERTSGLSDQAAYSDLRLMLGLERKSDLGPMAFVEAGWVFNRHLEYESGTPDFDPDDAFLLRAGIGF